jgi:hypothetical protein
MPYHIGDKGSHGCAGFPVIKDSDNSVMGCHKTKEHAKKQLAALYINEPEAHKEKTMATDFTYSYATIVKYDRNDDGTLMVYGKATDDSIDIDQQICDPTWLDTAMPEWFKSGGNIREQHSAIAAGVAKEYEKKADGHYITALVVDPISVKKVDTGVLKGFSIGIKSPRVVRDTKAANGRIIDGHIVEISLVDRPANPNCQLVLAKSVEGESSLVQVEELHEFKAPLPSDLAKMTKKGSKMETIKQITELAKSLTPDTVKFDKELFDKARAALAELIVVEANEMATEGSDERMSIAHLLESVSHLLAWYEGEEAEGEVAEGETAEETIELSTSADKADTPCDCDGCAACKASGGCDKSPCEKCMMAKSADNSEKTLEMSHKCLECGCNVPQDSHGRTDVTTAEIVTPDETPKSAEADEVVPEVVQDEVTEVSEVEASDAPSIEDVVEKAVKSAMESVRAEIDQLRAEKESAVEKSVSLESELTTALSKTAVGGPKRTAVTFGAESNEYLVKAVAYKAKADATTDPVLQKGYRALYEEFSAKAATPALNK